MMNTISRTDITGDWNTGSSWIPADGTDLVVLTTAAASGAGVDNTDLLTVNTLGVSLYARLWFVARFPVMGRSLFNFLPDCISRISGTRDPDTEAVIAPLRDAALGNTTDRELLATTRLNSKRPLSADFRFETDQYDNALVLAAHQSSLALEELLRGRAFRSVIYAQKVVDLVANRTGADPRTEYQWMIDRAASYLST